MRFEEFPQPRVGSRNAGCNTPKIGWYASTKSWSASAKPGLRPGARGGSPPRHAATQRTLRRFARDGRRQRPIVGGIEEVAAQHPLANADAAATSQSSTNPACAGESGKGLCASSQCQRSRYSGSPSSVKPAQAAGVGGDRTAGPAGRARGLGQGPTRSRWGRRIRQRGEGGWIAARASAGRLPRRTGDQRFRPRVLAPGAKAALPRPRPRHTRAPARQAGHLPEHPVGERIRHRARRERRPQHGANRDLDATLGHADARFVHPRRESPRTILACERRAHGEPLTWKPWKGFHTFPRWFVPGKAGRLPTRLGRQRGQASAELFAKSGRPGLLAESARANDRAAASAASSRRSQPGSSGERARKSASVTTNPAGVGKPAAGQPDQASVPCLRGVHPPATRSARKVMGRNLARMEPSGSHLVPSRPDPYIARRMRGPLLSGALGSPATLGRVCDFVREHLARGGALGRCGWPRPWPPRCPCSRWSRRRSAARPCARNAARTSRVTRSHVMVAGSEVPLGKGTVGAVLVDSLVDIEEESAATDLLLGLLPALKPDGIVLSLDATKSSSAGSARGRDLPGREPRPHHADPAARRRPAHDRLRAPPRGRGSPHAASTGAAMKVARRFPGGL